MIMQNLMMLGTMAKIKLRNFFSDEKGEVNIVAIVVLIGIAVILALFFKDAIVDLLKTLFEGINTNTDSINDKLQYNPPVKKT